MAARSKPRRVDVLVGGETVPALVREVARRRTLRLTVLPGPRLELAVPARTSARALRAFLGEHAAWLDTHLAAAREEAERTHTFGLQQPGCVWLSGRPLPVVRMHGSTPTAAHRRGVLEVSGTGEQAAAAIDRWYRREARRRVEDAVAQEARRLELGYERISIRDQRTRWGSCSSRGTLSFNWRLVLAPPPVLDYVVVHELLHVREPNHSRRFWALLDEHHPGWRTQTAWLRDHGAELLAYDPAAALA
jgi:predicted metal-dependent hydrolase